VAFIVRGGEARRHVVTFAALEKDGKSGYMFFADDIESEEQLRE
jgi:hypothetical protein